MTPFLFPSPSRTIAHHSASRLRLDPCLVLQTGSIAIFAGLLYPFVPRLTARLRREPRGKIDFHRFRSFIRGLNHKLQRHDDKGNIRPINLINSRLHGSAFGLTGDLDLTRGM